MGEKCFVSTSILRSVHYRRSKNTKCHLRYKCRYILKYETKCVIPIKFCEDVVFTALDSMFHLLVIQVHVDVLHNCQPPPAPPEDPRTWSYSDLSATPRNTTPLQSQRVGDIVMEMSRLNSHARKVNIWFTPAKVLRHQRNHSCSENDVIWLRAVIWRQIHDSFSSQSPNAI